jgi:hypothetical protein
MHLAQVNIARAKGPLDGPMMTGFVARLEAKGPTPFAFTFRELFPPE